VIETILKVESAVNEEEAISLAQSLLHKGLLVPVKNKKKYKEVFKPTRLYWFAPEGQVRAVSSFPPSHFLLCILSLLGTDQCACRRVR